jgi:hypothetical protein
MSSATSASSSEARLRQRPRAARSETSGFTASRASAAAAIAALTIGANGSLPVATSPIAVSFAKNPRRSFESTRSRFVLPRFPPATIVRIVLLAVLGIVAAAWALAAHYAGTRAPMRTPAPTRAAPTYDPDAGELPVPELDLPDGG